MNRIIPYLTFILAAGAVVYLFTRDEGDSELPKGAESGLEDRERDDTSESPRRQARGSSAPDPAPEVTAGVLSGRCVNAKGEGVPAAITATLFAPPGPAASSFTPQVQNLRSDDRGRFALSLNRFLRVKLRARAAGYRDYVSKELLFTGTGIDVGDIQLQPGIALEMKVSDESGQAAVDALVEAGPLDTRGRERGDGGTFFAGLDTDALLSARSNSEGRVRIDGLAPGKLQIRVRAPGFLPWASRDHVLAAGDDEFEIRLSRGRSLELTFRDEAGAALPGVEVSLDAMGYAPEDALISEDLRLRGRGNASGALRIGPLGPRPYRLVATRPGFIAPSEEIIRKEDRRASLVFRRAGRVTGRIEAAEGQADVSSSSLTLAPLRKRGRATGGRLVFGEELSALGFPSTPSDFAVVDLQGGNFRLTWTGGNGDGKSASGARGFYDLKDLEPGEDRTVVLQLAAAASASGQVLDFRGQPVPDATVSARLIRAPDKGGRQQAEKALLSGSIGSLESKRRPLAFRPALNHQVPSDALGAYRISGLMVGARYSFHAESLTCGKSEGVEFLVSPEGLVDLDLRLPPHGSVSGRLLDSSGAPLPGRIVYLRRDQGEAGTNPLARIVLGPLVGRTWTDLDGRFRFDAIPPGSLALDLGPQRQGQAQGPREAVNIRAGRESQVELRLPQ